VAGQFEQLDDQAGIDGIAAEAADVTPPQH
jgi:hypothetical protein